MTCHPEDPLDHDIVSSLGLVEMLSDEELTNVAPADFVPGPPLVENLPGLDEPIWGCDE